MRKMTFTKQILPEERVAYQCLGWTLASNNLAQHCGAPRFSSMAEDLVHIDEHPRLSFGQLRRPLGAFRHQSLFGAIAFSESQSLAEDFKPAYVPDFDKALSFAFVTWPMFQLRTTKIHGYLRGTRHTLQVLSHFSSGPAFDGYCAKLRDVLNPTRGQMVVGDHDAWFDITNGSVMSFDKHFMVYAASILQRSFMSRVEAYAPA